MQLNVGSIGPMKAFLEQVEIRKQNTQIEVSQLWAFSL